MATIQPTQITAKDGSKITIRTAVTDDAEALLAHIQTVAEEQRFITVSPHESSQTTIEQEQLWITSHNEKLRQLALIGETKHQIAALAHLTNFPQQRLAHVCVLGILLHINYRNLGIGKTLLQTLIDWARRNPELAKIQLGVRSDNHSAIALYKKCGFQQEGLFRRQLKSHDNKYIDIVKMALFV